MPPRKRRYERKRRNYRKKAGKRFQLSRIKNTRNTTIQRGLITSDTSCVHLPLMLSFTHDPVVGSSQTTIICANDLYDPSDATGAYQPLGFDEWMAFYKKFCVLKSSIFVKGMATGTTVATNGSITTVHLRPDTTAITDWEEIQQSPKKRSFTLNGSNSKGVGQCRYGYNISKWFGQNVTTDNTFKGTSTTSPSDELWYHITTSPFLPSLDITTVYYTVKVIYTVMFTDRNNLVESTHA